MKLQNLFVATAILATTVVGGTTFAAEGTTSTNSVGVKAGEKVIKTVPTFTAEELTLSKETVSNNNSIEFTSKDETISFEDFTAAKGFTLRAKQEAGFKAGENSLPAKLTYNFNNEVKSGMGQDDLEAKASVVFANEDPQTIIAPTAGLAYGDWTFKTTGATAEFTKNQVILPGAYTSTVNWDLGETPVEVEPEA